MKRMAFMIVILFLALNGCEGNVTIEPPLPATSAPFTITPVLPTATITPIPEGKTIVVTSAEDSGPGTLRQAILDAISGDTITFDPEVFPPDNPTTIFLDAERQDTALPEVTQGYLIINASDAGVILDGSHTSGEWVNCLSIRSNGNVVRGLQIVHFPGSGLALMGGSQNNIIGGDRNKGSGPLGQGNLSSGNRTGIDLQDNATSFNVITGNLIGADADGLPFQSKQSQDTGIYIANGASHNTVGPGNIIAYNSVGVQVHKSNSLGNTITQNSIYDNMSTGICLNAKGNASSIAPSIVGYDLSGGSVTVFTCPAVLSKSIQIRTDKEKYMKPEEQPTRQAS